MKYSDKDVQAYDNAVKSIEHERKGAYTRRQMLKASAATVGATLAAQFVPSTVYGDVSGTIVHFAASGKRLSNTLTAVKPLFAKVFLPNLLHHLWIYKHHEHWYLEITLGRFED